MSRRRRRERRDRARRRPAVAAVDRYEALQGRRRWASRSSWAARPGRVFRGGRCRGGSTSWSRRDPAYPAEGAETVTLAGGRADAGRRARAAAWRGPTRSASSAAARSIGRRCGCRPAPRDPCAGRGRRRHALSRRSTRKCGEMVSAEDIRPAKRTPCDTLHRLRRRARRALKSG